jgi:hypothetical protein
LVAVVVDEPVFVAVVGAGELVCAALDDVVVGWVAAVVADCTAVVTGAVAVLAAVVADCTAEVTGAVAAWTVEVAFGSRSARALAGPTRQMRTNAATWATSSRKARPRRVRRSGGRVPNELPPTGNG